MEACVIFTPCLDVDVNCLLISSWRQQPRGVDTQQFSFFVLHEQVVIAFKVVWKKTIDADGTRKTSLSSFQHLAAINQREEEIFVF